MRKVEKASERHNLVLDVIIDGFIQLQKVSGSKRVTVAQFTKVFSESIDRRCLMKASFERLSRLIKVCGFLMQTKVYLFWKNLNA